MSRNSNRSGYSSKTLNEFFGPAAIDHHAVLGVRRNASRAAIAAAYRILVKQFHPDVNTEPSAAEQFKRIQEAFEVLHGHAATTTKAQKRRAVADPVDKPVRKRRTSKTGRPDKPKGYKGFPLYAHPAGYWAKKINKKLHYFGRWGQIRNGKMVHLPYEASWRAALELYKLQRDDLHAGRVPRTKDNGRKILAELCDRFLDAKRLKMESGELSVRSYQEYYQTAVRLQGQFGSTRLIDDILPDDFQALRASIAKNCGPVRLGNEITRVKSFFKFAKKNKLVADEIEFGSEFAKPDKSVMRRNRADRGKKLFTRDELQLMLDAVAGKHVPVPSKDGKVKPKKVALKVDPLLRALILLGANAGAGNTDVANLLNHHLDLKGGWLNYPRGKTGIDRRVPLWPETVAAIKSAVTARPKPKHEADAECVFLTPRREGDIRTGAVRLVQLGSTSRVDYVSDKFSKLLKTLHINGRKGLGFYSLRHTFATIGLQTGDRDAVKALMGHAESDMLSVYDETGPSDERLQAVTNHVRGWLFGEGGAT